MSLPFNEQIFMINFLRLTIQIVCSNSAMVCFCNGNLMLNRTTYTSGHFYGKGSVWPF